ncbi:MAG: DUF3365 domain-containing protein [Planctomycetaceae bacterium]|nr:DUF3365 domain-containing protein [Planctomycetaceae bacterium]
MTLTLVAASLAFADEAINPQTAPPCKESDTDVTISAARIQAKLLHSTIHSTLRVVHDRYYREDELLPIPAAAMNEVFLEIEASENVKLRWLAVEGQAMNIDHVARNDFETKAVEALKSGQPFYEETTGEIYRRAAPITLSNHCLKCHMPDRKSTRDRRAGFIVTVPLSP